MAEDTTNEMIEEMATAMRGAPPETAFAKDQLFSRLPQSFIESLTPEQRATLWSVANAPSWRRYPVNLRLTLPLIKDRWFLTVVAGRERRSGERLRRDSRLHPVRTMGNTVFLLGVAGLFYVAAFAILVTASSLVEF